MKRSACLLLAISLVLPAMASAQMGRSGGVHSGRSGPGSAAAPSFRGGPRMAGPPRVSGGGFRVVPVPSSSVFVRGGSFPHTIGTIPPDVFTRPIGTNDPLTRNGGFHHHRNHRFSNGFAYPFAYYPGYYYPLFGWDYDNYDRPEQSYNMTPNVVYVPVPESSGNAQPQAQEAAAAPSPQPASPARDNPPESIQPTVLVFRDGHTREVSDYAIMGSTLYVLSGKNARIAIADLDVPATVRANQEQGMDFKVPAR